MNSHQWPQPEQNNQAYRTWSNIVGDSTYRQESRLVFNSPEDFIPLDSEHNPSDETLVNKLSGSKDPKHLKRKLSSNEKAQQNSASTSDWDCTPWKSKNYIQNPTGLNEEIHDFLNYIKPRPEEDAIRRDVVERVEAVIRKLWPQAKVELYGSCQTGLYLPTSDIDLVVHGKWQCLPLRTLENALLEQEIADANSIRVLDKATVPIIKVMDKKTEVKVDISFNMNTGVQSADMIKNYLKIYPALPYLTFVIKQFLLNRDLNEVFCGGISSYTVVLMIVSYFQHSGHFNSNTENEVNLGVLLIEFFELYGKKFNYNNVGIRLINDGSYFNKEKVLGAAVANTTHLCIEDPLTEGNYIGKSSFRINEVKKVFEWACSVLTHAVLNDIPGNESCSILGRIIRLRRETIEQRGRTLKLAQQCLSISSMPSYASVATRNTRYTTIRSINGIKTIDLIPRPEAHCSMTEGTKPREQYPEERTRTFKKSAGDESEDGPGKDRGRKADKRNDNNNKSSSTQRDKPPRSPNPKPSSPKRAPSVKRTCGMRSASNGPAASLKYVSLLIPRDEEPENKAPVVKRKRKKKNQCPIT